MNPAHPADPKSRPEPFLRSGPLRDILWGRPVFRAPPLANPGAVTDSLPLRAHFCPFRRQHESPACGPLRAA